MRMSIDRSRGSHRRCCAISDRSSFVSTRRGFDGKVQSRSNSIEASEAPFAIFVETARCPTTTTQRPTHLRPEGRAPEWTRGIVRSRTALFRLRGPAGSESLPRSSSSPVSGPKDRSRSDPMTVRIGTAAWLSLRSQRVGDSRNRPRGCVPSRLGVAPVCFMSSASRSCPRVAGSVIRNVTLPLCASTMLLQQDGPGPMPRVDKSRSKACRAKTSGASGPSSATAMPGQRRSPVRSLAMSIRRARSRHTAQAGHSGSATTSSPWAGVRACQMMPEARRPWVIISGSASTG